MMDPVRNPAVSMDALLANSGWVRGLAHSLVQDEQGAEDLIQDMWLRALQSPPTRRETAGGWMATVLRNLARDRWRKEGPRAERESRAARHEALAPAADLVERAEAHRALIRHVTELREPYRTVVLLRFFEELPPREIAERLGVPPATIRTQIHRALGQLRATLDAGSGGRDRWALALLPLPGSAYPGSVSTGSATLTGGSGSAPTLIGGLVVTTKQKVVFGAALVLLLCGGAAWMANTSGAVTGPPPDEEIADAASSDVGAEGESERKRVEQTAEATPEETEPAANEELASDVVAPRSPPPVRRERLEYTLLRHVAPRQVPKGFKELAPGEEPVVPERSWGEGAPSGPSILPYWSRWAPVPETGDVTVMGRVTDATGRGLPNAQVYRVELDENGQRASPSSYQWIDEITKTDSEGHFVAREQPTGEYLITADFRATMRTRRGLDIAPGQAVSFGESGTLRGIDVQLPVESARLARVVFTVLDENGKPMRNAEIRSPLERLYTDADGRAELGGLQPGVTKVEVREVGYATEMIDVDLEPGESDAVEVQLDFAEKGDLVLEGRVVDEEGRPVAKAPIFLAANFRGSRWAKTDADGVFRFLNMDRKYEQEEVRVMVSPHPERDRFNALGAPVKTTVPAPGLELLVRRTARLHVLLRDAETGDPLSLYAIETQIRTVVDGKEEWRNHHSMSTYDKAGEPKFMVPKGRFRLTIRAKDHRGMQIEVDMPDALEDREVVVEMKRE